MKRILAMILALVSLLCVLTACNSSAPETPDTPVVDPGPTQSPEEQAILKVLTIGNSHSLDSTRLLYEIFKLEAPEQKVVLGVMYYSGCTMTQHTSFIVNEKAEYEYYKNEDGNWNTMKGSTLEYALKDEQWDIVVMQQMNSNAGMEECYVAGEYLTVINHVLDNQKVKPQFAFNVTWSNPDNYDLYLKDGAPLGLSNTAGWRQTHETHFAGADGKFDRVKHYEKIMELTQKYLVDSTDFLGQKYYEYMIPSATAIEYAVTMLERPQEEMYSDYTHVSDFGSLMVGYLWYAKLMGLDSVKEIKLNEVPRALHRHNSTYPSIYDMTFTEEMKADALEAVNYALAHPYSLPAA